MNNEHHNTAAPNGHYPSKAVILGTKEESAGLLKLILGAYDQVRIIETLSDLSRLRSEGHPCRLAILTDGFPEELTIELAELVKQFLAPENMICLVKDDDEQKERKLRSAGLIYYGSYNGFAAFAEKIILHTLTDPGSRGKRPSEQRKDAAIALEKQLANSSSPLRSVARRILFLVSLTSGEAVARVIELALAVAVLALLVLPLSLILLFGKLISGSPIFASREIAGPRGVPLKLLCFSTIASPWSELPAFLELITGRLSLVGTSIEEWKPRNATPEKGYIRMIKPGIISLWDIRRTSKMAHEGQQAIEWEYVFKKHPFYDFMLMLRALPVILYSQKDSSSSPIFRLLDLDVNNLTMLEAVGAMQKCLEEEQKACIYFVNPDCLNKMVSDREYLSTLQGGEFIFPDGIGLVIAGKMLKTPLKENINGTDMLPYLSRMAAAKGYSIFLLGGKPGIAEKAAKNISSAYGVTIAGTAHGYFDHQKGNMEIIRKINSAAPDILLVGFGAPLQEKWIAEYRDQIGAKMLMGVGGLFDFYSGTIRRAPSWIREIGFEWVYRILQEPGRMWRRYVIGNPLFLFRVIKWNLLTQSQNQ